MMILQGIYDIVVSSSRRRTKKHSHHTNIHVAVDRPNECIQVIRSNDKTIGEIDLFWWWSWPNDVKDNQQHNNQPKKHNNQPKKPQQSTNNMFNVPPTLIQGIG